MQNSTSTNIKISNLGSGIKYENELELSLRDYDDQIMVLDNENQIILNPADRSIATVKGFNSAALKKGVALFDNFIVTAEPGSTGVQVIASSKAIDRNKIITIFGSLSDNIIEADMRF